MERGSVMTTKERIRSLRDRVKNPDAVESCIEELKDVLGAESAQLYRAEASCCVGVRFEDCLRNGVQVLGEALKALEERDVDKGASLLEEYERITQ
jgi:hypothetical protein